MDPHSIFYLQVMQYLARVLSPATLLGVGPTTSLKNISDLMRAQVQLFSALVITESSCLLQTIYCVRINLLCNFLSTLYITQTLKIMNYFRKKEFDQTYWTSLGF